MFDIEDGLVRFIDPQFRDRALRVEKNADGWEQLLIDNKPHSTMTGLLGAIGGIGMQDDILALTTPGMRTYQDGLVPGGCD